MSKGIYLIGKKLGMSQIFDEEGNVIPVTVVEAGPCVVVQIKKVESDGYNAIRVAFDRIKESRLNNPELGVFKKNNLDPHRIIKEFRVDNIDEYKVGDILSVGEVEEGKYVDVTGITKGKGFQGVVKRWNFKGGPKTRGQKDKWRAPGSIGNATYPGRVWKGKKMAGRMGGERKTVQGLKIVGKVEEKNLLFIKGSVPGATKGILLIKESVKKKG